MLVPCVAVIPVMTTVGELTAVVTRSPVGSMLPAVVVAAPLSGVLLVPWLALFAGVGLIAFFCSVLTFGTLRVGGFLSLLAALAVSVGGLFPQCPPLLGAHIREAFASFSGPILSIPGGLIFVRRLVRRGQGHFDHWLLGGRR